MKKLIATLALLALTAPASAGYAINCSRHSGCYGFAFDANANPQIINVPEGQRIPERERAWEAFCQPKIVTDNSTGVGYYVYAHPGCEFGRIK